MGLIPASSGQPLWLRRNNGVFMVYEQMLQRSPYDHDKSTAFFIRGPRRVLWLLCAAARR